MYRRALAIDPAYFPALRGLAQVLPEGSGEHRSVLETAVGLRLDPLLVLQLGEIYENEGLSSEAQDLYSRALQASPNDSHLKAAIQRVTKQSS
jgi:tetratricopeptide (TPR) repeat protein